MNTFSQRVGSALKIHPGEGRLVGLVLAYGFCLGLGRMFSGAAVSGMFLDLFGARALPYSFLGTAAVVPLTGLFYLRLQGRVPLSRLIAATIIFLIVAALGFRVALSMGEAPWLVMALMIGYATVYVLVALAFWSLVGQLFNVRQGKRLFGLLGSGGEVSDMSAGLLTLLLAPLIGAPNLLLLACAGLLAALLLLRAIVRRYPLKVETAASDDGEVAPSGIGALMAKTYVRLLLVLVALSQLGYFFVENMFYDLSMTHFSGPDQFSALVGATVAASSLLTILLQVTVAGRLISRFGLHVGLPALPALLLLGSLSVALAGAFLGGAFAVFVLMLITRVSERALRFSIDETSVQICYQPLPASQRSLLQTMIDGGVKPLAAGVAGAVLLLFTRLLGFDGAQLAWLLVLVSAGWLVIALALGRNYRHALLQALSGRRLNSLDLQLNDSDSLTIINRSLRSPHSGEALYALELLVELEHPTLSEALIILLEHPEAQVRREALRLMASNPDATMITALRRLFAHDSDPAVRGQALRILAILGPIDRPLFDPALADPAPELRLGAAVALARSQGITTIEPYIHAWATSADPGERELAAAVLSELGGYDTLVSQLLRDPVVPVRRAALAAVPRADNPALWPQVVVALGDAALRPAALAALACGGRHVLVALDTAISDNDAPLELRIQAARAAGKLGPAAGDLLVRHVGMSAEEVRHSIVAALDACGYSADAAAAELIRERIRSEAASATRTLAIHRDLGPDPRSAPLRDALIVAVLRSRERILGLLSAFIERPILTTVRDALTRSHDQQAYAIEALDLLLPQALRPVVLPLLEAAAPAEALPALERIFPQQRCTIAVRLAELRVAEHYHPWVMICAQVVQAEMMLLDGVDQARLLFERVQLLQGSSIFQNVPVEELLGVAGLLIVEEFPANAIVFAQGDPGGCAYLIAAGRVRAHDGPQVLNELGPREIFGELAVLDARPRSLTITTSEPSQLLRLEREALFALIADHVAVARGIISVLIRNLRSNVRELGAFEQQAQAMAEHPLPAE